ncbi:MAG: hypothetical protein GF416_08555, partial [Candidatus Altiarchaeales archaeon]|nr:hypothetical protein [Candidatus Altiarchaeales archaeon]MBD3417166.1 hypothetical protein [Candidatus Altiarchaeales archaeon]
MAMCMHENGLGCASRTSITRKGAKNFWRKFNSVLLTLILLTTFPVSVSSQATPTSTPTPPSSDPLPVCNDGIDNDGDGLTDALVLMNPDNGASNFWDPAYAEGLRSIVYNKLAANGMKFRGRTIHMTNLKTSAMLRARGPNWDYPNIHMPTVTAICNILGYETVDVSSVQGRTGCWAAGGDGCNWHSPEDNYMWYWNGNDMILYDNPGGAAKYRESWIAQIRCVNRLAACNDGFDNDGDGLWDMNDPGCYDEWDKSELDHDPGCLDVNDPDEDFPECMDTLDNELPVGDGLVDADDPGCWTDPDDPNTYDPELDDEGLGTSQCQDGIDNYDGDSLVDAADPGCWTDHSNPNTYDPTINDEELATSECQDGIDNTDQDLLADDLDPGCWTDPNNPGTYDPTRYDEGAATTQCQDTVDNELPVGDGLVDAADPGCWTDPDNPGSYDPTLHDESLFTSECQDIIDNDDDFVADAADPGCWTDHSNPNTYDPTINDESLATTECQDGDDNDQDRYTDNGDPGCWLDPTDQGTYDQTLNDESNADIPPACEELWGYFDSAYTSQCGDASYNIIGDMWPEVNDGFVDLGDLSAFAANFADEAWCQEQLDDTQDPCKCYDVMGGGICEVPGDCACLNDALGDEDNCYEEVLLVGDIIDQAGTCVDNPDGFNDKVLDCQGHTIDGDGSGSTDRGILVEGKSGVQIQNCVITDFTDGILVSSSQQVSALYNTVTDCYKGIRYYNSPSCALEGNTVMGCGYGIHLHDGSSNCEVIDNTAEGNSNGIVVVTSSANVLSDNTANSNSDYGIRISTSSNNMLSQNTVEGNGQIGLWFQFTSDSNMLDANRFCSNGLDISDGNANSGSENTCDTVLQYDDVGVTGCTYTCSPVTYYEDGDGDGYGNPNSPITGTSQPPGYVEDGSDCDDSNPDVHPGASEVCNGIDDNCDGQVDEGFDADDC